MTASLAITTRQRANRDGDLTAVTGDTFGVGEGEGEIFAHFGCSGSDKTTAVRMLTNVTPVSDIDMAGRATSGEIHKEIRSAMEEPNIVDLLESAVTEIRPVLSAATADRLDRPTPCAEWNLRALLGHVADRAALATRAAERIATLEFTEPETLGDDAATVVQRLLDGAVAAWRRPDADPGAICVTPIGELPGFALITFLAQDVFVHAWDISKTLGTPFSPDDRLTAAMLAMHHQNVTDEIRAMFFAPPIPAADTAKPLDQLVSFLGRQP